MTLALEVSDADRLRAQAHALQTRGFELVRQGEELKAEAVELRVEADRLEREPVRVGVTGRRTSVEHDADLMAKTCEALDTMPGQTSTELADHVGVTQTRMRAILARLEAIGMVTRRGIKRGTRYSLTAEDEVPTPAEPDNVREFQNYATVVRDAAVRLDTFTIADMMAELPDLSDHTVRRWVAKLEERGVVTSERVGNAKVYALVERVDDHRPRERKPTPEALAVREFARTRSSAPVAGTRNMRTGSTIVNQLIREVRQADPTVEVSTSAHRVEFKRAGVLLATASKTPGASSLKGTRGELRKAGVAV